MSSLVDALLLDPWREPGEVWIALRPDGQVGSGTINDPYNGSATSYEPVLITSLTATGASDGREALAVTSSAHGFGDGSFVTVRGVTDLLLRLSFCGTFQIYGVTANSFKYLMPYAPPGSPTEPGLTCVLEGERFDAVMRTLGENTLVHIGPGVFQTKGHGEGVQSAWTPKNKQRILGAGIGLTTLQLVGAAIPNWSFEAIGTEDSLEGFEVADLTVDCNVDGQPFPDINCGAINLRGAARHVAIRRVRVIHFGSRTEDYHENFVVGMGGLTVGPNETVLSVNCVIEECIAELPGRNNINNSTILHFGTGEYGNEGLISYHTACAIRNCYVNCTYEDGFSSLPLPIESIMYVGQNQGRSQYKLTTKTPHHRIAGDTVLILDTFFSDPAHLPRFVGPFPVDAVDDLVTLRFTLRDAQPGDPPVGTFNLVPAARIGVPFFALSADNGTGTLVEGNRVFDCITGGPYHDSFSTRDLTIRNNYYHNVVFGPVQTIGGVSQANEPIRITGITHQGNIATATTLRPHGLVATDQVVIAGVTGPTPEDAALYNSPPGQTFSVTGVPTPTAFTYEMTGTPSGDAMGSFIGYLFLLPPDLKVSPRILEALTYAKVGNDYIAEAKTTYDKHGLEIGDGVLIVRGASPGYPNNDFFNGYFSVIDVPDDKTFKYRMAGNPNPGSDSGVSESGYFGRLWRTTHLSIERNVLGLALNAFQRAHGPASNGFPFGQNVVRIEPGAKGQTGPPFLYRNVLLRENVLSPAVPFFDPAQQSLGLRLFHGENGLIQANIIDLPVVNPLLDGNCGSLAYLGNMTPSGQPLSGMLDTLGSPLPPTKRLPDLQGSIEESILLALL
jgi:hypothetical protein